MEKLKRIFAAYSPAQPFDFQFVDEEYASKFDNEKRTGKLAGLFAGLTVFISCLGLFGPTSAERNGPYGPACRGLQSPDGRMEGLGVGQVFDAARVVLEGAA